MSVPDRRRAVADMTGLEGAALEFALGSEADGQIADRMIENAIGAIALPLGVATNFRVNDRDYLVPMAVEEPSVIAAASHGAKRIWQGGGFRARCDASILAAQIQVYNVRSPLEALARILEARDEILSLADSTTPLLCARGGGARDLQVRDLGDGFLVTDVFVDCLDAMGANIVNTIGEALGPTIERLSGGTLGLRILSNLCDRRLVRVVGHVPISTLATRTFSGEDVAERVEMASRFAEKDLYRATTHNKGIMNGVDAVVLATGNDWRATEASAHAYAARAGRYQPLATWKRDANALRGCIELPLALGTVGGGLRVHPGARAALSMMRVKSAGELAMVAAATGLATNLSALVALVTEGIQRGHMALHHRAIAKGR